MKNNFLYRHIGPNPTDQKKMLDKIGVNSLDELIQQTVPSSIRLETELQIPEAISESEFLIHMKEIASKNLIFKSYIGTGYYSTILPPVIQRNILENPSWYTSYTPYQAEISQGRLEALINFQTAILELTGMDIANASLLDEATAAAESMIMLYNSRSKDKVTRNCNVFLVDEKAFPQTFDVLCGRAEPLGIKVEKANRQKENTENAFAMLLQYPNADGAITIDETLIGKLKSNDVRIVFAADILALAILKTPKAWGADVVIGSTQRFGIPMGYGGPHAAYFATTDEFKRSMPGRIIGITKDRRDKLALRMALQTREQHIKREKATSNICTAQALLATMAGMYAVYHGPEGIKEIASTIHHYALSLTESLNKLGFNQENKYYFDTLKISTTEPDMIQRLRKTSEERHINFRYDKSAVFISLDEATTTNDLQAILEVFEIAANQKYNAFKLSNTLSIIDKSLLRNDSFMQQEVFSKYHSETEMMRYMKRLEKKDFSLTDSMIPLGSCTMKLNAASEMLPISWPEFGNIHPFAPLDQVEGYQELIFKLGNYLKSITGFSGISFQPNSGASGEYAGLLVIREYFKKRGEKQRNLILIPSSAHGTNPASAAMAGFKIIVIDCDSNGNVDVEKLATTAKENASELAALMITYPSTHGVFEDSIKEIIALIHQYGGQVYMDGANMNAQVGITSPASIGADVCHLNLHKTFAIPHGGGGPGMGPIAVSEHLVEFLPTHPIFETGGINGTKAISASPFGSANILPISYAYCRLLGPEGLRKSTEIAILNANYIAESLKDYFPVLYKNKNGRVAHELILDCRPIKNSSGISETDIAKRLVDYGFHAPTLSFPVHGTLMIEPTESESVNELDHFIDAIISIHKEIKEVEQGASDTTDNVLKNAPHTIEELTADEWNHSYSRQKASYPLKWLKEKKFWPSVSRVNDAYGDRNLICNCGPIEKENYTFA